jgi:hypothetical protein
MEKNLLETYKSQYVKLVKDTGDFLDGTIIEILDKDIIFQTELARSAIPIDSIREIISYEDMKKRRKQMRNFKI